MTVTDILVATCGGTIDKTYGSGKGVRDLHIGPPTAPVILERMQMAAAYRFEFAPLFRLDSLDMQDEHRRQVVSTCLSAPTRHIIITHGTDTILKTAEELYLEGLASSHTIVLTGALLPACVLGSDAEFNLGLALATCAWGMPGIWIAINGVHYWDSVEKNDSGLFLPTKPVGD